MRILQMFKTITMFIFCSLFIYLFTHNIQNTNIDISRHRQKHT